MNLRVTILPLLLFAGQSFAVNEVYESPFAEQAPVLDGESDDDAWVKAPWKNLDKLMLGTMPDEDDFSARYKMVWTNDHLYLLAEIEDDVLRDGYPHPLEQYWNDDTLEIFLDEDKSGGNHLYNYNAFAYHIALDNQAVDVGPFLTEADQKAGKSNVKTFPDHIKSVWKRSLDEPHKIIWEVQITVYHGDNKDLEPSILEQVTLAKGKEMGLMVAYCDSDEGNAREHFMGDVEIEPINGDKNLGFIDASVFGSLKLVK